MTELEAIPQPFTTVIVHQGRRREAPATDPEAAHAAMRQLYQQFPHADMWWTLRSDSPAPAQITGRYQRNVPGIGESRRVAHLFLLPPGGLVRPGGVLTAWCGELVPVDLLDVLPVGGGMPCVRCLLLLPDPESPTTERRNPGDLQRRQPGQALPPGLAALRPDFPERPDPGVLARVLDGVRRLDERQAG